MIPEDTAPSLSSSPRRQWATLAGIIIGMIVITLAVFWQTSRFGFLNFDDDLFIRDNARLTAGLTWQGIVWAMRANLVEHEPGAEYWEPLTLMTRLADVQFYGWNAGAHHLTSVFLHLIAGLMLFGAMNALLHSPSRAGFIAALFLIHPLHIEAVVWLAARKDVLNGLFYFAALWAYAWYAARPNWRRYGLVCACFLAANMAKPMAVSLPFVLLLLDFWPLGRMNRPVAARTWVRLSLEKAPLLLIAAGVCLLAVLGQKFHGAMGDSTQYPFPVRIGNAAVSILAYLSQTFVPSGLAIYYPHPGNALNWPLAAISFAGCVAITVLCAVQANRRPWLIVGWLWFIAVLLPVSGIVQIGEMSRADRYTYVALVGIFLVCEEQGLEWFRAWRARAASPASSSAAMAIGANVILVALAFLAWRQTATWRDSIAVFTQAVSVTDDNYLAQTNLGAALFAAGRKEEGREHYAEALRIEGPTLDYHRRAGAEARERGDLENAIYHFGKVITVLPSDAAAHRALGDLLIRTGERSKALVQYNEVLHYQRGDVPARVSIARILIADHRIREARGLLESTLKLAPQEADARQLLDSLPAEAPAGSGLGSGNRPLQ